MNILEAILIDNPELETMRFNGLDEAIIGVEYGGDRLIYSVAKCIEVFMAQGMTRPEAWDWFTFNVAGSYIGEQTPIFMYDPVEI